MRRWRFVAASSGLLVTAALLVWAATWLQPPRTTGLVLLGADYSENLLVPHNCYGWHVLEELAALAGDRQLQCWGKRLFQLVDPPVELHTGGVWDRPLKTCRQPTLLLYIAAHGAVDDRGPYLLLSDGRARGESGRLRLTAILDRIEKLPDAQQKILILDCTGLVANWSLGMLENEFARSLESLESRIAAIPNLVVISASGRDERSWSYRPWRQTIFGHYVLRGLQGDSTDTNHDGRIDAWDLYTNVRQATQRWAQANRAARQTPEMFPFGDVGYRRARRMDLVPVARHDPSLGKLPTATCKVPEEIGQAWRSYQQLANQTPCPAAYSPMSWRRYRDLLLRYEALILAGNRSAAARIHRRMMQSRADIEQALRQDVPSIQNSIAMYVAIRGHRPISSAIDPQEALETLWSAAPDQRTAQWGTLCARAGDQAAAQRLRITLQSMVLRRVGEDPPGNLRIGSELIRLADDPLRVRPAEAHFLVMLNRDLPRAGWDDQRRDLIRLALNTRQLAERTAWCLRQAGYAHTARVAPGIRPLVTDADRLRRMGEDLLFGDANDQNQARQHLQQAQQLYQQAGKHANAVSRAIETYVRGVADLPYYARWVARRRPDLRNDRAAHQDWLARFERIGRSMHRLDAILAAQPTNDPGEKDSSGRIVAATAAVTEDLQPFEQSLQDDWQMLAADDSPQAWCDLRNALRVPQKQPRLRMKLLASLFRTEQRLAAESTLRLDHPTRVTRQQQTRATKWAAQAEGRMALAALGRGGYERLVENNGPTYDELQHRLEVFTVEQQWWRSATVAGRAIGDVWCRIPRAIAGQLEVAGKADRPNGLVALGRAERLSRLAPGHAELDHRVEPADVARRARLRDVFLWQAGRTYQNHWWAEDPEAEPYYRVVARSYLDGAAALQDKRPVDKRLYQQLTAVAGLDFSAPTRLDMSTENELGVPVQLVASQGNAVKHFGTTRPASTWLFDSRKDARSSSQQPYTAKLQPKSLPPPCDKEPEVPAGFPVVWFQPGDSLQVDGASRHRSAWHWKPSHAMQAVLCNIASPALKQAERQPANVPTVVKTQLVVQGRFRGQILSTTIPTHLHLAPDLTTVKYARPERAAIAVRANEALHRQFGDGKGAVALVLDCSGSMGPAMGKPFSERTKYAEATRAVAQVLTCLPPGTTLSVWVFGQAMGPAKTVDGPERTILRVLNPVRWDSRDPLQLGDLMARIQYPTIEPWNESPIVRAILAAKKDLAGVEGFKTIVVLTDGIDNCVATDEQINPDGEDVPSLLRRSFQDSGIKLNIVGFRMADADEPLGWKQFHVVESLSPPGVFCTVRQREALAQALAAALRQPVTYRIETSGHLRNQGVHSALRDSSPREMDVSRTGANDQWYPHGLEPGNYWIEMNTIPRLEGGIALSRGDRLLLRLSRARGGLQLQRAVYGEEDFPWKPFQVGNHWRSTVLQNQRVGDGGLQMLLGMEPDRGRSGDVLSLVRPDTTWIELSPRETETCDYLVCQHDCWGYPSAAWRLSVPNWPTDRRNQVARPRLKVWWSCGPPVAPDAVLRRPDDFHTLNDLAGRVIAGNGLTIDLQSVTVEDHMVRTGPDRREMRTCLVVRLGYAPSHTIWARPGGLKSVGQEHRYYRKIGRYAGLFWPVTRKSANSSLTQLELVGLEEFQRQAEARGNVLVFDKLPRPDGNDVGPRPIVTPP